MITKVYNSTYDMLSSIKYLLLFADISMIDKFSTTEHSLFISIIIYVSVLSCLLITLYPTIIKKYIELIYININLLYNHKLFISLIIISSLITLLDFHLGISIILLTSLSIFIVAGIIMLSIMILPLIVSRLIFKLL